jgi:La-related protein 7
MAQDGYCESSTSKASASGSSGGCSSTPFRLNVHAREFVPVSPSSPMAGPMGASALAAAGYYSPFLQLPGGGLGAADWTFLAEPDPSTFFLPDFGHAEIAGATAAGITGHPKGANPADIAHKIIKQVRTGNPKP